MRIGRSIGMRSLAFIGALGVAGSCGGLLEHRVASPVISGDEITFRVKSPSARTVQLAGDWTGNNWARGDAEAGEVLVGLMDTASEEGVWEITVRLEPGRYRYRFLVNETTWMFDPDNPRIVDDGRGGKANLLVVP